MACSYSDRTVLRINKNIEAAYRSNKVNGDFKQGLKSTKNTFGISFVLPLS